MFGVVYSPEDFRVRTMILITQHMLQEVEAILMFRLLTFLRRVFSLLSMSLFVCVCLLCVCAYVCSNMCKGACVAEGLRCVFTFAKFLLRQGL